MPALLRCCRRGRPRRQAPRRKGKAGAALARLVQAETQPCGPGAILPCRDALLPGPRRARSPRRNRYPADPAKITVVQCDLISQDRTPSERYDSVMAASSASAATGARTAGTAVLPILLAVSAGHFLNDTMQSALLSIYPLIKEPLALDFVHIGIITLAFQLTASILQPMIGLYTDKHPQPFSLPFGMAVDLRRHAAAGGGRRLRRRAAGRGPDRHRQLGVPPRGVARGAARRRRALRLRPVGVPGRRQCRAGDQPAARGAAGDPQRPALHRLVRARGRDRHRDPLAGSVSGTATIWRCRGPAVRRSPPCRRSGAAG